VKPLYSYLKQKSFYKNEGKEVKTVPAWGLLPVGGVRIQGKSGEW
jgi:hypothetical protein